MPLKLNVGLTKKIGLPDYGSVGASCHVEVELEGTLLQSDLDGFHDRVRAAFTACRQAVQDELTRHQCQDGAQPLRTMQPAQESAQPLRTQASNGSNGSNGNGVSHRATEKQFDYLRRLASQIPGLGIRRVEQLAAKMLGKPLAELTSFDASALIDQLKAIKAGEIDVDQVLGSGAAT